ncbi:MAG: hypothetical protein F4Y28_06135 [Acidimicrobiia bacterium]|nr:hypothetical protein [Acidimicrobiia bacterium]MYG58815.1 hypothetical protein [Acidimicrobiia bacterium]MYJ33539.1 hypothetical protein [Acidimicrobiia bacterium]
MQRFTFTLTVQGRDLQAGEDVDALFDAGCDDALVGSFEGAQFLDFDREAGSIEEAMLSAVADVESVEGLTVTKVAGAGSTTSAEMATRAERTP